MLNIRFPINVYLLRLVQYRQNSSAFINVAYQELLKHVNNQDKIKTEQFRQILPYLKTKDSESSAYKPVEKQTGLYNNIQDTNITTAYVLNKITEKRGVPDISKLTNIFDTLPEKENTEPQSSNKSTEQINKSLNSVENSNLLNTKVVEKCPPQELPASLIPTIGTNASIYYADLSNACLPLSIHHIDGSIFTTYVQDVNHVFFKLLVTVDKWMLQTNKQGQHLCTTVKKLNDHPGLLHDLLRQQVTELVLYRDKTALWLCEKKEDAVAKKEEKKLESTSSSSAESIVDKIKKIIAGILANLKNQLEEQKRKQKEEKKKKDS